MGNSLTILMFQDFSFTWISAWYRHLILTVISWAVYQPLYLCFRISHSLMIGTDIWTLQLFVGQINHTYVSEFLIYLKLLLVWCRHYNPTVLSLSRQMAAMEGTEAAYCTASGMSAIAAVLMQLCSSGDHIVASNRLYGGTHAFLAHFLPRSSNVTTTFVDVEDLSSVQKAIKPSTKVLYFESMSNPQLSVANIPLLAGMPIAQKSPITGLSIS